MIQWIEMKYSSTDCLELTLGGGKTCLFGLEIEYAGLCFGVRHFPNQFLSSAPYYYGVYCLVFTSTWSRFGLFCCVQKEVL